MPYSAMEIIRFWYITLHDTTLQVYIYQWLNIGDTL